MYEITFIDKSKCIGYFVNSLSGGYYKDEQGWELDDSGIVNVEKV